MCAPARARTSFRFRAKQSGEAARVRENETTASTVNLADEPRSEVIRQVFVNYFVANGNTTAHGAKREPLRDGMRWAEMGMGQMKRKRGKKRDDRDGSRGEDTEEEIAGISRRRRKGKRRAERGGRRGKRRG